MAKRKKKRNYLKAFFRVIWFLIKIPYFIIKVIIKLISRLTKVADTRKIEKKRESLLSSYSKLKIIKSLDGNIDSWEKSLAKKDSIMGIILGARGTGKSALGIKLLENLHSKKLKGRLYAIGFLKAEMPSWIEVIDSVDKIKNNSFVLIDEGGVIFSSRSSMTKANKILSDLVLISRHKNISILFISQNSSNLDVNILRQADFLMLKPSSLLQKDFERKKIKELYSSLERDFKKFKSDKGLTYIHSDAFQGFVSNSLPSFWSKKLSKSFR